MCDHATTSSSIKRSPHKIHLTNLERRMLQGPCQWPYWSQTSFWLSLIGFQLTHGLFQEQLFTLFLDVEGSASFCPSLPGTSGQLVAINRYVPDVGFGSSNYITVFLTCHSFEAQWLPIPPVFFPSCVCWCRATVLSKGQLWTLKQR